MHVQLISHMCMLCLDGFLDNNDGNHVKFVWVYAGKDVNIHTVSWHLKLLHAYNVMSVIMSFFFFLPG